MRILDRYRRLDRAVGKNCEMCLRLIRLADEIWAWEKTWEDENEGDTDVSMSR